MCAKKIMTGTESDILLTTAPTGKRLGRELGMPKRLSKLGEWMKAHPNGLDVEYINWRAVLR